MVETRRRWPSSYMDRLIAKPPSTVAILKSLRRRPSRTGVLADAARIPVAPAAPLAPLPPDQTAVTWVGHASFVIRIGGLTVLTDPVWSRRIPGAQQRLTPPGLPWSALPTVDAVVISHNHYDHLDAPTIRRLPRTTPMFVPAKLGLWFRRRGFKNVTELDWYEARALDGVSFDFVPARHWSRRSLFDTAHSLWGGWVLTGPAHRVYFAGDTGYGQFLNEIAGRYRDIDLALLPVGAYEPPEHLSDVHLNPAEAVRACADLSAPRMATMHWGTFVLSTEPVLAPLEETRRAWAQTGRLRENLWDLAVGETRML